MSCSSKSFSRLVMILFSITLMIFATAGASLGERGEEIPPIDPNENTSYPHVEILEISPQKITISTGLMTSKDIGLVGRNITVTDGTERSVTMDDLKKDQKVTIDIKGAALTITIDKEQDNEG